MFPTAVSSRDLAAALASRLDAAAPEGLRVRASGDEVNVHRNGRWVDGSAAPRIVHGALDGGLETAAMATISGIQDVFAEELTEPWPARSGEMPVPDVRIEGGVLLARFGSGEKPALSLASYPLQA